MKDIVVEQDVNPEVDKPSKKKQLDVEGGGKDVAGSAMDWETASTPLEPASRASAAAMTSAM